MHLYVLLVIAAIISLGVTVKLLAPTKEQKNSQAPLSKQQEAQRLAQPTITPQDIPVEFFQGTLNAISDTKLTVLVGGKEEIFYLQESSVIERSGGVVGGEVKTITVSANELRIGQKLSLVANKTDRKIVSILIEE